MNSNSQSQSSNFLLRPDIKLYPKPIDALVECFKHSVLGFALTSSPAVPATLVYRAHFTAIVVNNAENVIEPITHEVLNEDKTTRRINLNKSRFAKALQIPIPNQLGVHILEQIIEMFMSMGYSQELPNIGLFMKGKLSTMWKFFFGIFL